MNPPDTGSQRLLEQLLSCCPDFVLFADREGRVRFVNQAGRHLVGMPAATGPEGLDVSSFLTEEGLERRTQMQPVLAREGSWIGPSTLRDWRTDEPIPVSVTAFAVRDLDGTLLGSATIQRDQRDLLAAEQLQDTIEGALADGEPRAQEFLLHMQDLLIVVTVDGEVRYAGRSARRLLGVEPGGPLPNLLDAVAVPERRALARQLRRSAAGQGNGLPVRMSLTSLEGRTRRYEALLANLIESPDIGGIVVAARDVSERDRAAESVALLAEVLEKIAAEAPLPVVLDLLCEWMEHTLDRTAAAILLTEPSDDSDGGTLRHGASPSLPLSYAERVEGLPLSNEHSPCAAAARSGAPVLVHDLFADESHAPFHELARECGARGCWAFPITSPAGGVLGALALYPAVPGLPDDVTRQLVTRAGDLVGIAVDRTRLVARLQQLAHSDALTGLPNRPLLLDRLDHALRRHRETGSAGPVLVFLDLDRLKVVNDSLGHDRGDELLVHVANRLRDRLPSSVLVARFGGDEFVILDEGSTSEHEAVVLAGLVLEALGATVELAGHPVTPTGSAGVVVARPGQTASDVLRDADIAMYRAKGQGGSGHAVFTDDMRRRAYDRLTVEAEMRTALSEGQFRLRYQPVWDLAQDDALVGFEALVRWQHPSRGLLLPQDFLTLAEETGLIVPLGTWVLDAATTDAGRWRDVPFSLAVNVAGRQLLDPGFVDRVRAARDRMSPWTLCLELTESTVMGESADERAVLDELAGLGLSLAVDDFGTGFSSLSRLATMPVEILKIDRSFVAEVDTDSRGAVVVSGVTALASSLGMATVAEGIERTSQLEHLRAIGCRFGQGFLLGRPMTADQAQLLLHHHGRPT